MPSITQLFAAVTSLFAWSSPPQPIASTQLSPASAASPVSAAPDHWAVLVAGSNGIGNYRHQADVCHAYHVLRNRGIPADHIITMAFDDIANNSQNDLDVTRY